MTIVEGAAGVERVILYLSDLSCVSCAKKIEQLLEGLDGVETASVSFASSRARVAYAPERVDVDSLKETVHRSGYRVREVRRETHESSSA